MKAVENSCRTQQDQNTGERHSTTQILEVSRHLSGVMFSSRGIPFSAELLAAADPSAPVHLRGTRLGEHILVQLASW